MLSRHIKFCDLVANDTCFFVIKLLNIVVRVVNKGYLVVLGLVGGDIAKCHAR